MPSGLAFRRGVGDGFVSYAAKEQVPLKSLNRGGRLIFAYINMAPVSVVSRASWFQTNVPGVKVFASCVLMCVCVNGQSFFFII